MFSYPDHLFWLISITIVVTALFAYKWFFVSKQLRSIFIFRIFLFLIVLLVYLNPSITKTDSIESNLFWNIYVDKSLSMSYHSSPSINSLLSGIDDMINRLNKKDIPLKIYNPTVRVAKFLQNNIAIINTAKGCKVMGIG